MCPILARHHYFVTVLNMAALCEEQAEGGGQEALLEDRLRELLVDLANTVRDGVVIGPELAGRLNQEFLHDRALSLRLDLVQRASGSGTGIVLSAAFADDPGQRKRMYMEAIVSLLEAIEKGGLELQHCEQCGQWFIPYSRAGVTKFCGTKCRNRYHYVQRKKERKGEQESNDYVEIG